MATVPVGRVALVPCLLWGLRAKSQFSGHWVSVLFLALQATTRDLELFAQCPHCRSWLPFSEAVPGLRNVGTSDSWGLSPVRGPHPGFTETLVPPLVCVSTCAHPYVRKACAPSRSIFSSCELTRQDIFLWTLSTR